MFIQPLEQPVAIMRQLGLKASEGFKCFIVLPVETICLSSL